MDRVGVAVRTMIGLALSRFLCCEEGGGVMDEEEARGGLSLLPAGLCRGWCPDVCACDKRSTAGIDKVEGMLSGN